MQSPCRCLTVMPRGRAVVAVAQRFCSFSIFYTVVASSQICPPDPSRPTPGVTLLLMLHIDAIAPVFPDPAAKLQHFPLICNFHSKNCTFIFLTKEKKIGPYCSDTLYEYTFQPFTVTVTTKVPGGPGSTWKSRCHSSSRSRSA